MRRIADYLRRPVSLPRRSADRFDGYLRRAEPGGLSLFLAIVLAAVVALTAVCLPILMTYNRRVIIEQAMNGQLAVSQASYDRGLLERYGLLGLRASKVNTDILKQHFREEDTRYYADLEIKAEPYIDALQPNLLLQQITQFMKPRYPIELIKRLKGAFEGQRYSAQLTQQYLPNLVSGLKAIEAHVDAINRLPGVAADPSPTLLALSGSGAGKAGGSVAVAKVWPPQFSYDSGLAAAEWWGMAAKEAPTALFRVVRNLRRPATDFILPAPQIEGMHLRADGGAISQANIHHLWMAGLTGLTGWELDGVLDRNGKYVSGEQLERLRGVMEGGLDQAQLAEQVRHQLEHYTAAAGAAGREEYARLLEERHRFAELALGGSNSSGAGTDLEPSASEEEIQELLAEEIRRKFQPSAEAQLMMLNMYEAMGYSINDTALPAERQILNPEQLNVFNEFRVAWADMIALPMLPPGEIEAAGGNWTSAILDIVNSLDRFLDYPEPAFMEELFLNEYIVGLLSSFAQPYGDLARPQTTTLRGDSCTKLKSAKIGEVETVLLGKMPDFFNRGVIKGVLSLLRTFHQYAALRSNRGQWMILEGKGLVASVAVTLMSFGQIHIPPQVFTEVLALVESLRKGIGDMQKLMRGNSVVLQPGIRLSPEVNYADYMRYLLILTPREWRLQRLAELIERNLNGTFYDGVRIEVAVGESKCREIYRVLGGYRDGN
ncbi:MAG: hypothetical protein GX907_02155 [Clostridiaceae bacterium]|nr:hypothetical protein [Clostridiaceae bacterium]